MKNNRNLAVKIHENAYDMFPTKHMPLQTADFPFPMYSYEREDQKETEQLIRSLKNNE